jgi:hypothetical protein
MYVTWCELKMTLIIFLDINTDDRRAMFSPKWLDDINVNISDIHAHAASRTGIINLDNLVTRNDTINQNFIRAIRSSGNKNRYYGDDDFELPDNPNSGNITISHVSNEMDGYSQDLEQAFNEIDCRDFTASLRQCMENARGDELIRLVISSNDRRIEHLPFLKIPFIRSRNNQKPRNICVQFIPRSEWLIRTYF